jgi:transcriptional regulator with XRE-family HTH domain
MLGEILKKKRVFSNFSQEEVAEKLGVSLETFIAIEEGKAKPDKVVLEKISGFIGMPLPIVNFLVAEEADVSEAKKEAYRLFKPILDAIIKEVWAD